MQEIMLIELSEDIEKEIGILEDLNDDVKNDLLLKLLEWWQMTQISRDEGVSDGPCLDASEIDDINSLISRNYSLSLIIEELKKSFC
ncbi:MAG: hypothetical protein PHD91_06235 [bacterium]|jgi:hypothetical protein|nr:hypothetical protein [bacterium]MDD4153295.1 hypothetical protein [bacterium]MDD4558972.1 hypothetical protein [bacterium]